MLENIKTTRQSNIKSDISNTPNILRTQNAE